ncbi:phytanoyl-CoA dioxygenase family protein [Hyphomicrobium sp.]|uniref:phytanoyl-CoA dioxygenase family protein n=1 Tax=Hyphomicrobium sp. TaxID=82 RepID=UPI000FBCDDA5|nr:phytanoyl-CoA dioxygenase family protein [Hyphomicrobium sp.]RUP09642.1 MAG: phytanoyl-CoA dioxygenase [Hyphomicrobium sp.]
MTAPNRSADALSLSNDGVEKVEHVLTVAELEEFAELAERQRNGAPGSRLVGDETVRKLLSCGRTFDRLATTRLGNNARAVRAVFFDKNAKTNWALGWHQDRTIVVREKIDMPGFGPWTTKSGAIHVEPPFSYIEGMITLRAYLDPCRNDNGPLRVAPGSHRKGRIPTDAIPKVIAQSPEVTCLAEPGDVWICATAIVHASYASHSQGRRRLLMVDYAANDLPSPLRWAGI